MYARNVDGEALTFGVEGDLIMNALVMYDRETESLWSQFLAEAVKGPLKGTRLEMLPSLRTSWAAWKRLHPESLVLDRGYPGPSDDPYYEYYLMPDAGSQGETNRDKRLRTKDVVIGLTGESGQRAYGYSDVASSKVLNDTFEGGNLVAVYDGDSGAMAVYDRDLDGQTLTFDEGEESSLMVDRNTGSTWNKNSGAALTGPLAGKRLQAYPFIISYWFAWTDFYPETELHER